MSRITPYKGTSLARLVALMNQDNDTGLQYGSDFNYGPIKTLTPDEIAALPPEVAGANTTVVFVPTLWDGAFDAQTLYYTRLDLSILTALPPGSLLPIEVQSFPFDTLSILSELNEALGLDLVPNEVLNQTYSFTDLHYALAIDNTQSYAWIGELELNLTVPGREHIRVPIASPVMGTVPNPQLYDHSNTAYRVDAELLQLVKEANPTASALVTTDVTFTSPRALVVSESGANSRLQISATESSAYYGAVEVDYNRLPLTELVGWTPILSEVPFTPTVIAAYLNQLGAQVTESDVLDSGLPTGLTIGETGTFAIRTSDSSFVWMGERNVDFVYGLPYMVNELHEIVTVTLPTTGYLI